MVLDPQFFRYERPQRGRLREHFQLNCDIIGEESPEADAELVVAFHRCRARIRIYFEGFCRAHQRPRVLDELLKLEKVPPDRWEEILRTIDKSEREPREKTEKLGELADPVFEIFEKAAKAQSSTN